VLVTLEQWAVMSGQADGASAPAKTLPTAPIIPGAGTTATPSRLTVATALSVADAPKIKRNRILPEPDPDEVVDESRDDKEADELEEDEEDSAVHESLQDDSAIDDEVGDTADDLDEPDDEVEATDDAPFDASDDNVEASDGSTELRRGRYSA